MKDLTKYRPNLVPEHEMEALKKKNPYAWCKDVMPEAFEKWEQNHK